MTNEQAKSELMQIYGLLSEERKIALDVAFKAMEQADNIPVMYYPQVDGITPTVVAQADGEYISKQVVLNTIDKWYEDKADIEDLIVKITYMPRVVIPSAEPKMVEYTGDGYADGEMVYDMANCPNCGRDFEDGDETWNCNFCPDCGQALKWEGEQE